MADYKKWERLEMADRLKKKMEKQLSASFSGKNEYVVAIERTFRGETVVNIQNTSSSGHKIHVKDWNGIKKTISDLLEEK